MQAITDFLNIFGEATVPMVLLIVFTLLFVGKIAVAERSRRLLRSDLKQLLDQAVTPLGADTGLVVFFDRETDELFTDVAFGLDEEFFMRSGGLRRGSGVSGRVLETGESLIVDDLAADSTYKDHPMIDVLVSREVRSVVAVPLRLGDRVLGVMNLSSRTPGHFKNENLPLLETIAAKAAETIGKEHIFEVTRTNWEES